METPLTGSEQPANPAPPAASAPRPRHRLKLALIFLILLMDVVGIMVLAPVAPFIVKQYSDSALAVTMVTMIFAAAQFFSSPLMGKLGDRFGRRPVLLLSLLGQAFGYLIFAIGGNLFILYLGRVIGGFTAGSISTASAYIADISEPHERAKNFSLVGIAWSLGVIVGPAAGAALGQISLNAPAFVSAAALLVGIVVSFFFLPESLPKEHRNPAPIRPRDFNPVHSILEMGRKPGLGWLLVAYAIFALGFNGVQSTAGIFYIDKFEADPAQVGMIISAAGVAIGFVQFLLVQPVVRRFGERRVLMSSLVGQGLGYLALFLAPMLWMIVPFNMIAASFGSFIFPTFTTLTINHVQQREVGLLLGVTASIGSLMAIFGPLYGGLAYDYVMPGAPFWMAGILYALTFYVIWRKG
jgi:DHA1 family tetracycline resistance protein-like MFS transporter